MIATKTFFLKTKKIHIIKEGRKYDYSRYCDQICIFVCTYYIDFDVAKNIKIVFSSLNVFYICFAVDKISSYLIIFITIICILRCLVYYHFKSKFYVNLSIMSKSLTNGPCSVLMYFYEYLNQFTFFYKQKWIVQL